MFFLKNKLFIGWLNSNSSLIIKYTGFVYKTYIWDYDYCKSRRGKSVILINDIPIPILIKN